MLYVQCIDTTTSTVLVAGELYYAFPFGAGTAAYISRFPREGSHMGGFQMSRFKVITEEEFMKVTEEKKRKVQMIQERKEKMLKEMELAVQPEGAAATVAEPEAVEVIQDVITERAPETATEDVSEATGSDDHHVCEYLYTPALSTKAFILYGYASRYGQVVLFMDQELMQLVGATAPERVEVRSQMEQTLLLSEQPYVMKAITYEDLEDAAFVKLDVEILINKSPSDCPVEPEPETEAVEEATEEIVIKETIIEAIEEESKEEDVLEENAVEETAEVESIEEIQEAIIPEPMEERETVPAQPSPAVSQQMSLFDF